MPHGDVGLEQGSMIVGADGSIQLAWLCPGCGATVTEESTALAIKAKAAEVAADAQALGQRAEVASQHPAGAGMG